MHAAGGWTLKRGGAPRKIATRADRVPRAMGRTVAALLSLLVASGEAFGEDNAADAVEARHASRAAKSTTRATRCLKAGCLKKNANRYFDVWNSHDVSKLRGLLAAEATLRDWDVEVTGGDAVAAANAKIFAAVPGIKIEVLTTHVAVHTLTAVCEILVRLNNEKGEATKWWITKWWKGEVAHAHVLKVVDIITFDEEGKIVSVRAYKG